jgi:hypothetical protein
VQVLDVWHESTFGISDPDSHDLEHQVDTEPPAFIRPLYHPHLVAKPIFEAQLSNQSAFLVRQL